MAALCAMVMRSDDRGALRSCVSRYSFVFRYPASVSATRSVPLGSTGDMSVSMAVSKMKRLPLTSSLTPSARTMKVPSRFSTASDTRNSSPLMEIRWPVERFMGVSVVYFGYACVL